jgi:transposase-like protein
MGKYRVYDAEFKTQVVLEALRGQKSQAEICREHGIAADLLCHWRDSFLERAPELFQTRRERSGADERIAELERLVGQLTLELSAVKKVSSALNSRWPNGGRS